MVETKRPAPAVIMVALMEEPRASLGRYGCSSCCAMVSVIEYVVGGRIVELNSDDAVAACRARMRSRFPLLALGC